MRPGLWQVIIVIALIVLFFGAAKIPDLARSLGRAKGEFKKGLAEGESDADKASAKKEDSPELVETKKA